MFGRLSPKAKNKRVRVHVPVITFTRPALVGTIFNAGQQGLWYDPSIYETMFSAVPFDGYHVTGNEEVVSFIHDLTDNLNHTTGGSYGVTLVSGNTRLLSFNRVDTNLSLEVPVGGFVGTMILATDSGTATYEVNIPAGTYIIGPKYSTLNGLNLFPSTNGDIIGQVIRHGAFSAGEITSITDYMIAKGAPAEYTGVINFVRFWMSWTEITTFPLIDTSSATNLYSTWWNCTGLTSFPLINTVNVWDFRYTWFRCSNLTSFPSINATKGEVFDYAWGENFDLTSFPSLVFTLGTSFWYTWKQCTSLTSFPAIAFPQGNSFVGAWADCTSLTSFPAISFPKGVNFYGAWAGCTSLTSFPAGVFDTIDGGDLEAAFTSTALTEVSIDRILASLVASGGGLTIGVGGTTVAFSTRIFGQSGGTAPSVATGRPHIDTLRDRGWTITVTGGY